ncbi:MAG: hypothetical protein D6768_07605, partial [Chloroflexi bacterium]
YQTHCAYYAEFLYQRSEAIESGDQRRIVAEITAELNNVRAAWQWAIAHSLVPEIQKMTQTFTVFCHYQSRYLEAAKIFEQVKACLTAQTATKQTRAAHANVLVRLGWFYIRLGNLEAAQAELMESRAILAQLGISPQRRSGADPLPPLSILATIRGDYAEAIKLGQLAQQTNEARNDLQNLAFAYYVLTSATLAQGDYEAARQHAQKACEVAKQAGNRWFLAYCLNEWGNVARAMGDNVEAEQHFQESYRIRETFDDPEGMAVALNHLGELAIRQANFLEAQRRYQQSLAIYQEINDRGGLAVALYGLGQIACAVTDFSAAIRYYQQALTIAGEIQYLPLIQAMFIGVSELFLQVGLKERAWNLLTFIRHYPAGDQETKDRAELALKRYEADFTSAQLTPASQPASESNFETMVATMQNDLALTARQTLPQTEPTSSIPANQSLLDPLTERELQVLGLMAAGRSNREIGDELVLALGSVKWYASQIYSKLQVKNRTEAAARARQLNLL